MLQYTEYLNNQGMIGIIARTCNHVDSRLMDHGMRVAGLVSKLLTEIGGYDQIQKRDICCLAMFHDIGAYKTEEIDRMTQFETGNVWEHSIYGYLFIENFSPLFGLAPAVLLHHTFWETLKDMDDVSEEHKRLAQIIFISDRADIYLRNDANGWGGLIEELEGDAGRKFSPEIAGHMIQIARKQMEGREKQDGKFARMLFSIPFTQEEIAAYLEMIISAIDFRSHHTVTHTMTTVSISYEISRRMGLSLRETNQVVCGAMLHDLGKIGVPVEILEYPGKLSPQEMEVMRGHVNIAEEIFGGVIEETIQRIALRHHEKLDGSGYPRRLKGEVLTVQERIVAVADIVSALAGTRSYKEAFPKDRIVSIITSMGEDDQIDKGIVDLIVKDFEEIMEATRDRCRPILDIYRKMRRRYEEIRRECVHGSAGQV